MQCNAAQLSKMRLLEGCKKIQDALNPSCRLFLEEKSIITGLLDSTHPMFMGP